MAKQDKPFLVDADVSDTSIEVPDTTISKEKVFQGIEVTYGADGKVIKSTPIYK